MHMLLTSLSAIYQGRVPVLHYGLRHVDQVPRAHLRFVLTGEIILWIDKLITYISDPQNNEDPEPYSKSFSSGGTELAEQELVRKTTKRQKTHHTTQKSTTTHNLHINEDPNAHKPSHPMQELPQELPYIDDPTNTSKTLIPSAYPTQWRLRIHPRNHKN